MNKKILIDYREHKILDILTEQIYCKQNLDVGDIIFMDGENILLIIERKTLSDLNKSIIDGRYKEQKNRLLTNYPVNKLLYLIEGDISKNDKFINQKSIMGSLFSTMLNDNINIWITKDLNDTILFIKDLENRFINDKTPFNKKSSNSQLVVCKKKINTSLECLQQQLCQVPGISIKKSEAICKKWLNMKQLIMDLNSSNDNLLENILVGGKKIGIKLSNKIYFFLGIDKKKSLQ